MKPTIHNNGTARQALLDRVLDAARALEEAIVVMARATPNGRDYYPQGSGAIEAAVEEHATRIAKIGEVLDEMRELSMHICDVD